MADLTNREWATVLFALRFLQANVDEEVEDLMRGGEHFKPMNDAEIGTLCEGLNTTSKFKYEVFRVDGIATAKYVASDLVAWSVWFEFTPLPDDIYEFRVKAGEGWTDKIEGSGVEFTWSTKEKEQDDGNV